LGIRDAIPGIKDRFNCLEYYSKAIPGIKDRCNCFRVFSRDLHPNTLYILKFCQRPDLVEKRKKDQDKLQ
jgi:hypothetical protein